ncbi:hypothetical protein [Aliidiomarina sp.]|uniref:hypothetical protein n=1 Tax=Aliidiomarina sp. TaxID=1872439 RepID=UPI003A4D8689
MQTKNYFKQSYTRGITALLAIIFIGQSPTSVADESLLSPLSTPQVVAFERSKTQYLITAIIASHRTLLAQLHRDVSVYENADAAQYAQNARQILRALPPVADVCQENLAGMRLQHANDQIQDEYHLPLASIYFQGDISPLFTRLEELENPEIDPDAYEKMNAIHRSLFGRTLSRNLDSNSCWALLGRRFPYGKDEPLMQRGCSAFDVINDCIVEMREIHAISDAKRVEVSLQQYEGTIPLQKNPYRRNSNDEPLNPTRRYY